MAHSLGGRIRELRERAGLGVTELGKLAGLQPSYVSKIEHGERVNVSLRVLSQICDALDYSVVQLIEDLGYGDGVSQEEAAEWRREVLRYLDALPPEVRAMQIETLRVLSEAYERRRIRAKVERQGQGQQGEEQR